MQPPPKPGFLTGLRCLFGGIGFVMGNPVVWPLAAIPTVLFIIITALLGFAAFSWVPALVGQLIGPTSGTLAGVGAGAAKVFGTLLAMLLSGLVAFALAQPLSGPALEGIVRMQEEKLGMPARPPTSFLLDIGRSIKSLATGYMFGIPMMILLMLISFFVPFAAIITVPLKLLVASYTIAWDMCDYPLSMRGLRIRVRLGTVLRHWSAVLGFSIGLALAALIPCALFFMLPFGVAGATRLMVEVEQHERARGREMDGLPPQQLG